MQRVLTEFNEVKNLIYAHTGITLDEYSAFYQYIVEFSEYTSIVFQVVDLTSTETQTTKRMIFCFRRRNYSDIDHGPFTTDYFNALYKYHDEDYGGYYLATSKKINEDPDGNTWEGYVDYWIVDSENHIITDPYTEAGYFSEYLDVNETITVYENYDSAIGDYSDFTFTVVDSFTNLYNSTRQSVLITTMTELNALFKAKAGIDIPTTNAEYTDYSMYDKVQEYLNFGAGVHIVVYRAVESDQTVPQKVWVIRPYYSTHDVSYDDLYIRPDSDTEAMLTSRTELIYTRFDFWNLGTEYEVYDEDSNLYEGSYTYMGFYPDLYSSSPSSCIEAIYGLKEPPTMDEAVQQYRDLCEDIAAAIKETIGLRPNTTKLETWLYNTPRAYGWSNYSGYTYRDDAKEDIVNECIKALASYEDQVYYCSIDIEYYETASRGTSGCTSYIDIYKYTSQSRYAESVKTYLCRFRLNINTSGTSYPKYIGIAEKITENIQDISHYGVDYSDTLYDKRYPNQNLLIPKTTIKPYEFAKTILGSGPESNHYNYRWILRETANAIRSRLGIYVVRTYDQVKNAIEAATQKTIDVTPWIDTLFASNWKIDGTIPDKKAVVFMYIPNSSYYQLIMWSDSTAEGVQLSDISLSVSSSVLSIRNNKSNYIGGPSVISTNGTAWNQQGTSYGINAGQTQGIGIPSELTVNDIVLISLYWGNYTLKPDTFPEMISKITD